jgi:hypothetical protein
MYPMDMLLMIQLLGQSGGFLFHAAGVIHEGKAILFVGRSGAGKSTISKLWLTRPGVTLLNDDRVIVRRWQGQYQAFGNPWHGEVSAVSSDSAPLERIYLLKHGPQNCVTALKPVEAVSRLLSCSFPTYWDAQGMEISLGHLEKLIHSVPCFELAFLPDERVLDFVQCL